MKVAVLGAGVIGVTTAQALAAAGHEVTVIDHGSGPAQDTSFANGGQISALHTAPWATPQMPYQAFSLMFRADAPLRINPLRWDPALWRWCLMFLGNCTAAAYDRNIERARRVAVYSRSVLKALRQRHNLQYDHTTGGILYPYRDAAALAKATETAKRLADAGLPQTILDRDGLLAEEPGLAHSSESFAGAILSPDDETGDARAFTEALATVAASQTVTFVWDTEIRGLKLSGGIVTGVETADAVIEADAFVVSLGVETPRLLKPLGLSVPIYPAKGYSLTAEITDAAAAPQRSITDEAKFIVMTRLGNRIRAAGTAELAGFNRDITPGRLDPIIANTKALFPKAADYNAITPWAGLRPATPDSVPIIGPTLFDNLFINSGHGTLGWTMACGAAQATADLISGRTPEIDMDGLGLSRFSR